MFFINKKLRAFGLLEMIISISILSIIGLSILNIAFSSKNAEAKLDSMYEDYLELDYAIDYIRNEYESADYYKFFSENKASPNWVGLIMIKEDELSTKYKYSITSYYLEDKKLYRMNYKSKILNVKPKYRSFYGKNLLLNNLDGISYSLEGDLLKIFFYQAEGREITFSIKLRGDILE